LEASPLSLCSCNIALWKKPTTLCEPLKDHGSKFDGIEIIEPLSYKDNIVKTKVKFHLKNTGNSPAVDVISRAKLIILDLLDQSEPRAYCESLKDEPMPGGQLGYVSFPGIEPIEEEGPLSVDLSKNDLRKHQTNVIGPPPVIFYAIVACTTYRLTFGKREPHQTGIIFNLLSKKPALSKFTDAEAPIGALGIDPKLGDLTPSDLRLSVRASYGN
jgi:hypothetical protein